MTCSSCRYYAAIIDDAEDVGVCRRYPPQVIEADGDLESVRPVVEADNYCGEWAGKIN